MSDPSAVPVVSVIVPAYNAMPYLLKCLDSLVNQTIGTDVMEVVVVDDGSSDGTSEELDRWAAEHPALFNVVHHPGSGGPATPRNTGLGLARGKYVFFVDADDYLGYEALERLVATAEENNSDIVLGRMQGDGGRGVPASMFRRSESDVDLYSSRIYWTLAPLKLFRRAFVEEHALRFPTQFPNASDQPFTAQAYLRADRISVNADYDYYFAVRRDDGQHVTSSGTFANRLDVVEWMCAMLAREVPDQARREHLLHRHFQIELRRTLTHIAKASDPADQQELLTRLGALVRTHLTPGLAKRLPPLLCKALEAAADEDLEGVLRGNQRVQIARTLGGWKQTWEGTDLVVTARTNVVIGEPISLVAKRAGAEHVFPAQQEAGTITGRIPATELEAGRWKLRLRVGVPPTHTGFPITSAVSGEPDVSWRTPRRASAVIHTGDSGAASLEISAPSLGQAARKLKQRIRR